MAAAADKDEALKRLGGGRWQTRDARFTIEPQSGTWVVVDAEQVDDLGLPLVRGPFGSLGAAKDAIAEARASEPVTSPLAARAERIREDRRPRSAARSTTAKPAAPARSVRPPRPKSARSEEPRWITELDPDSAQARPSPGGAAFCRVRTRRRGDRAARCRGSRTGSGGVRRRPQDPRARTRGIPDGHRCGSRGWPRRRPRRSLATGRRPRSPDQRRPAGARRLRGPLNGPCFVGRVALGGWPRVMQHRSQGALPPATWGRVLRSGRQGARRHRRPVPGDPCEVHRDAPSADADHVRGCRPRPPHRGYLGRRDPGPDSRHRHRDRRSFPRPHVRPSRDVVALLRRRAAWITRPIATDRSCFLWPRLSRGRGAGGSLG